MQAVLPDVNPDEAPHRPTALDLGAAGLLAATVALHFAAMFPQFYGGSGQGSLWSEPDQAAQFTLLAAGWALALGISLTGPARARIGAALAVGLGATEFGFRLSDLGQVLRYGSGQASVGLWLMATAWVVGAAGAALAVVAVRRRWGRPAAPDSAIAADATRAPVTQPGVYRDGPHGAVPTMLVTVLAMATAGAFLPAWDHYVGIATTSGRVVTFNLGNAFAEPWQVVIGTVLVGVALVAIPVVAVRWRARAVGATLVAGALIVLGTQFTSAVVQVDQAVPPSVAGVSPSQATQLGLQLHMSLTGWFTLDVLAAFALFVAAMVLGHARAPDRDGSAQASSAGTWPSAPDARSSASIPSS